MKSTGFTLPMTPAALCQACGTLPSSSEPPASHAPTSHWAVRNNRPRNSDSAGISGHLGRLSQPTSSKSTSAVSSISSSPARRTRRRRRLAFSSHAAAHVLRQFLFLDDATHVCEDLRTICVDTGPFRLSWRSRLYVGEKILLNVRCLRRYIGAGSGNQFR